MKEKNIELNKVNLIGTFFTILVFTANLVPYAAYTSENFKNNLTINTFLILGVASIAGIVIHELIHGICFARFNETGFKSIKFGAYWKHLAFYCHCSEPIKVKHYLITLLMPSIILGFLPLVLAYTIQSFALLFFACTMICGGIGDFYISWLILKLDKDCLIIDHPSKVGFYYTENQQK